MIRAFTTEAQGRVMYGDKKIPHVRIGQRVVIPEVEPREWVSSRTEGAR